MKVQTCGALVFIYLCASALAGSGRYHNNTELHEALRSLSARHPHFSQIYSIGKSVNGTELDVIRLASPHVPVGTPHVKLIGNIHGNEPLGRELLLRLAEFLLSNYGSDDQATTILDSTYVHILPSLNPDGFAVSQEGECMVGPGRRNANQVDLNRNFPSSMFPEDVKTDTQPETQAVMEWMHKVPFVLSAALHGGSLVANYPYDVAGTKQTHDLQQLLQGPDGFETLMEMLKNNSFPMETPSRDHKTEDDEMFRTIASNYSFTHGHMAGEACPDDYTLFTDGITNGAAWYPITGSMQDYNYDFHGCMEITLELSCCKYPGPHDLDRYWNENKKALLNFIQQSHVGVKGVVRNGSTPVAKAAVSIVGRKTLQLTSDQGEYWKLLLPGTHFIQVEKDGFKTAIKRVMVPGSPSSNPVILNIDLGETVQDPQMPLGLDSIEPDLAGYDLPVAGWNFDPSVIQEYDEMWRAKVEERKRTGLIEGEDDEDNPTTLNSTANALNGLSIFGLVPVLMLIFF